MAVCFFRCHRSLKIRSTLIERVRSEELTPTEMRGEIEIKELLPLKVYSFPLSFVLSPSALPLFWFLGRLCRVIAAFGYLGISLYNYWITCTTVDSRCLEVEGTL